MVIHHIGMLGAWSHLVRSCYLQCSTVVLKRLAVDFGYVTVGGDALFIHLLYQLHQGNRLPQRLGQ
jgi:hypothetical protein